MSNIRENALTYVAIETKNIADLEEVSTDLEMTPKKFKEGTEDEFEINVIKVEDEEYRVPNSVLKQLKAQLEAKPELKKFTVSKDGEGLKTSYTVVPLE